MTAKTLPRLIAALMLPALLALSGCDDKPTTYQGWIEANLIFVGPDETGRVEMLAVTEGDKIDTGAPLFALDTELFRADPQHEHGDGSPTPSRRSSAPSRW